MKKNILFSFILFFNISLMAQECFMIPTETRYWDNSKTYNGYTLFGSGGKTYLIDFEGHIIRSWNIGTNPRFTEGGNIYDAAGGDPSHSNTWKELDWNGNTVWTYTESRSGYWPHHDFEKIYNPKLGDSTFIYIANKDLTLQKCLDAGCNPANSAGYATAQMDVIVEVDMKGNIIWEWSFFDHVVQDLDASKSTYGIVKNTPGRININLAGNPVQKDWLHCNSLDYNQQLDMIVINSVQGEFYVIDHGNTFVAGSPDSSKARAASSKGDFLYRFGDPARYNQGNPPSITSNWTKSTTGHKQIGGAHNIQWIKSGLPGAGNFLIFNNAENLFELTPQSYIFEINPFLDSTGTNKGTFVNPPSAGYYVLNPANTNLMKEKKNISKQVVWMYSSKNNVNFYSTIGGGVQRLPNGNTFVCSMNDGHLFEVAPTDTSVVWEYINPITRDGIKKIKVSNYPTYNAVFRAYRYPSSHPALLGKDLTPQATITTVTPNYYTPADLIKTGVINPKRGGDTPPENLINQNYPNPFDNITTIDFEIKDPALISINIYNVSGMEVKTLLNEKRNTGKYSINWDGTDNTGTKLSSGMYYYIFTSNNKYQYKKMIYNR
ncbi:MAG: aryl-sulfate sulfotransferase [Bacteroidota bacterium]